MPLEWPAPVAATVRCDGVKLSLIYTPRFPYARHNRVKSKPKRLKPTSLMGLIRRSGWRPSPTDCRSLTGIPLAGTISRRRPTVLFPLVVRTRKVRRPRRGLDALCNTGFRELTRSRQK